MDLGHKFSEEKKNPEISPETVCNQYKMFLEYIYSIKPSLLKTQLSELLHPLYVYLFLYLLDTNETPEHARGFLEKFCFVAITKSREMEILRSCFTSKAVVRHQCFKRYRKGIHIKYTESSYEHLQKWLEVNQPFLISRLLKENFHPEILNERIAKPDPVHCPLQRKPPDCNYFPGDKEYEVKKFIREKENSAANDCLKLIKDKPKANSFAHQTSFIDKDLNTYTKQLKEPTYSHVDFIVLEDFFGSKDQLKCHKTVSNEKVNSISLEKHSAKNGCFVVLKDTPKNEILSSYKETPSAKKLNLDTSSLPGASVITNDCFPVLEDITQREILSKDNKTNDLNVDINGVPEAPVTNGCNSPDTESLISTNIISEPLSKSIAQNGWDKFDYQEINVHISETQEKDFAKIDSEYFIVEGTKSKDHASVPKDTSQKSLCNGLCSVPEDISSEIQFDGLLPVPKNSSDNSLVNGLFSVPKNVSKKILNGTSFIPGKSSQSILTNGLLTSDDVISKDRTSKDGAWKCEGNIDNEGYQASSRHPQCTSLSVRDETNFNSPLIKILLKDAKSKIFCSEHSYSCYSEYLNTATPSLSFCDSQFKHAHKSNVSCSDPGLPLWTGPSSLPVEGNVSCSDPGLPLWTGPSSLPVEEIDVDDSCWKSTYNVSSVERSKIAHDEAHKNISTSICKNDTSDSNRTNIDIMDSYKRIFSESYSHYSDFSDKKSSKSNNKDVSFTLNRSKLILKNKDSIENSNSSKSIYTYRSNIENQLLQPLSSKKHVKTSVKAKGIPSGSFTLSKSKLLPENKGSKTLNSANNLLKKSLPEVGTTNTKGASFTLKKSRLCCKKKVSKSKFNIAKSSYTKSLNSTKQHSTSLFSKSLSKTSRNNPKGALFTLNKSKRQKNKFSKGKCKIAKHVYSSYCLNSAKQHPSRLSSRKQSNNLPSAASTTNSQGALFTLNKSKRHKNKLSKLKYHLAKHVYSRYYLKSSKQHPSRKQSNSLPSATSKTNLQGAGPTLKNSKVLNKKPSFKFLKSIYTHALNSIMKKSLPFSSDNLCKTLSMIGSTHSPNTDISSKNSELQCKYNKSSSNLLKSLYADALKYAKDHAPVQSSCNQAMTLSKSCTTNIKDSDASFTMEKCKMLPKEKNFSSKLNSIILKSTRKHSPLLSRRQNRNKMRSKIAIYKTKKRRPFEKSGTPKKVKKKKTCLENILPKGTVISSNPFTNASTTIKCALLGTLRDDKDTESISSASSVQDEDDHAHMRFILSGQKRKDAESLSSASSLQAEKYHAYVRFILSGQKRRDEDTASATSISAIRAEKDHDTAIEPTPPFSDKTDHTYVKFILSGQGRRDTDVESISSSSTHQDEEDHDSASVTTIPSIQADKDDDTAIEPSPAFSDKTDHTYVKFILSGQGRKDRDERKAPCYPSLCLKNDCANLLASKKQREIEYFEEMGLIDEFAKEEEKKPWCAVCAAILRYTDVPLNAIMDEGPLIKTQFYDPEHCSQDEVNENCGLEEITKKYEPETRESTMISTAVPPIHTLNFKCDKDLQCSVVSPNFSYVACGFENSLYLWKPIEKLPKTYFISLTTSKMDLCKRNAFVSKNERLSGVSVSSVISCPSRLHCLAANPIANSLMMGYKNIIESWCPFKNKCLSSYECHTGPVYNICFKSNSTDFVSSSEDQRAILWDFENSIPKCIYFHDKAVKFSTFHPKCPYLVTATSRVIYIWTEETCLPQSVCRDHTADITGIAFSMNGDHLASCDISGLVHIWDIRKGRRFNSFLVSRKGVRNMSYNFSVENSILATAGYDNFLRLYDDGKSNSQSNKMYPYYSVQRDNASTLNSLHFSKENELIEITYTSKKLYQEFPGPLS